MFVIPTDGVLLCPVERSRLIRINPRCCGHERRKMNTNGGIAETLTDYLTQLGGISADRVRMSPPPGTATLADCIAANESGSRGLCELVDGTLVEKASSFAASVVAGAISAILGQFVSRNRVGLISGASGFFRLPTSTRGPDVAFLSRERLPQGTFPREVYPSIAPNLVVEVLSPGNTKAEMARKRLEYFLSGVELMWIVDCTNRTVAVCTSLTDTFVLGDDDIIDAGNVVPGFTSPVRDFFMDLDIGQE